MANMVILTVSTGALSKDPEHQFIDFQQWSF
jgi:hypothetical protein